MAKAKKVAILVEELYQVLEVWYPLLRLKEEGIQAVLVGSGSKPAYGSKEGYPAKVDCSVQDISSKDFDGAKSYCTTTSGAAIDGLKGMMSMAPETKLAKTEVKCNTTGDKSTCVFCCAEGKPEETYNLIKENGNWKVEYVKSGTNETTEPVTEDVEAVTETPTIVADENMDCDEFLKNYKAFIDEYVVVLKAMKKNPDDASILAKSKELGDKVPTFVAANKCLTDATFSTKFLEIATSMTEALK